MIYIIINISFVDLTITNLFHTCEKLFPEKKDDMILITSNETSKNTKYEDVTTDWKNKWVFTSPSIIYGLSDDSKSNKNIYGIYTNKGSTLNAQKINQQLARVRNPESIHVFIKQFKYISQYNNLNDVYKDFCLLNKEYYPEINIECFEQKFLDNYKKFRHEVIYDKDQLRDINNFVFDILYKKGHIIYDSNDYIIEFKLKDNIKEGIYRFEEQGFNIINEFKKYVKTLSIVKKCNKNEINEINMIKYNYDKKNNTDI